MLEVSTGEIGVVAVLKLFNSLINLDCLLHDLQEKWVALKRGEGKKK